MTIIVLWLEIRERCRSNERVSSGVVDNGDEKGILGTRDIFFSPLRASSRFPKFGEWIRFHESFS